jgi:hypothetical protein
MVIVALYSIPLGSSPFKPDAKYFTISVIGVIAVIQLLFFLFRVLPSKPFRWWRRNVMVEDRIPGEVVDYRTFFWQIFTGRGWREARNDKNVLGLEESSLGSGP